MEVKAKIETGASVADLESEGVTVEVIKAIGRRDNAKVSDASILQNAFDMTLAEDNKSSVKAVDLMSGDVALIVLDKVSLPASIPEGQQALVKSEILRENAIRDFSSALLVIKEDAEIDRNMKLVNISD